MSAIPDEFYRIQKLPPYVFAVINEMKAKARAAQMDVVDLGMGNPDGATPEPVVKKLIEAAQQSAQSSLLDVARYPAIARWRSSSTTGHSMTLSWIRKPKPLSPSAPRTRWRICCSP